MPYRDEATLKAEAEKIQNKIQELYDAGTPLFTRQALKELDEQMSAQPKAGEKVVARNIDGSSTTFTISGRKTGWDDEDDKDFEWIT